LLKKLEETTVEKEIQQILEEAAELENYLNLSYLTETEQEWYQELQDRYEKQATVKGQQLNNGKYKGYNEQVVQKVKRVYDRFKDKEKDYKKGKLDIVALMTKRYNLSAVNTDYLTTETMTYFNHVYNYIFGTISDEAKFRLTKAMTEASNDTVN
jgi:hypothetical protein